MTCLRRFGASLQTIINPTRIHKNERSSPKPHPAIFTADIPFHHLLFSFDTPPAEAAEGTRRHAEEARKERRGDRGGGSPRRGDLGGRKDSRHPHRRER